MSRKPKQPRGPDPNQERLNEAAGEMKLAAFERPLTFEIPNGLRSHADVFMALGRDASALVERALEINQYYTRDLTLWDWELRTKFTYLPQLLGGCLQLSVASRDGSQVPGWIVDRVVAAFFNQGEAVQELRKELAGPLNPHTRQFMLATQPLPASLAQQKRN